MVVAADASDAADAGDTLLKEGVLKRDSVVSPRLGGAGGADVLAGSASVLSPKLIPSASPHVRALSPPAPPPSMQMPFASGIGQFEMIELVSGEAARSRHTVYVTCHTFATVGVPVLQAQAMVDAALPVPPAGVLLGVRAAALPHALPSPCSRAGCVRKTTGAQHKASGAAVGTTLLVVVLCFKPIRLSAGTRRAAAHGAPPPHPVSVARVPLSRKLQTACQRLPRCTANRVTCDTRAQVAATIAPFVTRPPPRACSCCMRRRTR